MKQPRLSPPSEKRASLMRALATTAITIIFVIAVKVLRGRDYPDIVDLIIYIAVIFLTTYIAQLVEHYRKKRGS